MLFFFSLRSCRSWFCFFFSSRRRHTRCGRDWSSDVCSSDLGLEHEVLDATAIRARFRWHRVDPGTVGCYEPDAGVVFPERAVLAAVRAAEAAGARVAVGDPVTEVLPDPDRPRLRVGDRTLTARQVVLAGGAWTSRLVPALSGVLRVV